MVAPVLAGQRASRPRQSLAVLRRRAPYCRARRAGLARPRVTRGAALQCHGRGANQATVSQFRLDDRLFAWPLVVRRRRSTTGGTRGALLDGSQNFLPILGVNGLTSDA